jgi:hypothetical protein
MLVQSRRDNRAALEPTTGSVAVDLRGFTVAGSFRRCRCRSSHRSSVFHQTGRVDFRHPAFTRPIRLSLSAGRRGGWEC